MEFAKVIKDRYLFVISSKGIIKNLVVYRTNKGPIFAVYATSGKIKKFLNGGGGSLTILECSPDLRKPLDDHQKKQLLDGLKKHFKYKNPVELLNRILKASKKLENMDLDKLM